MPVEFMTLTFPNNRDGRLRKLEAEKAYTAKGWTIVSEEITDHLAGDSFFDRFTNKLVDSFKVEPDGDTISMIINREIEIGSPKLRETGWLNDGINISSNSEGISSGMIDSTNNMSPENRCNSISTQHSDTADPITSRDINTADRARALLTEANALYKEKKYREAIEKYGESLKFRDSPKVRNFMESLKKTVSAGALIKKANALYKERKFSEALTLYEESLMIKKNADVERIITKLQSMLSV